MTFHAKSKFAILPRGDIVEGAEFPREGIDSRKEGDMTDACKALFRRARNASAALAAFACASGCATTTEQEERAPIVLRTMGSLFFGGTVAKLENGETFHGDHGYAQFYVPARAHDLPLILWHGIGQSGRSWESTPDGREGFMAILPRRGWATYVIDQPRRGRAGRTLATEIVNAVPTTMRESAAWDAFRNGVWNPPKRPRFHATTLFPKDPASVEQFFRQQTPDTGAEPRTDEYYRFMGATMAELLKLTGPAILVTHSNSGKYGWFTGMTAPRHVRAIIAFEPGHFVFPDGEPVADPPPGTEANARNMRPIRAPEQEFRNLTKMPILIVYGDNIATKPSRVFNENVWRISSVRAEQFADAVNRRGGDVRILRLPEIGIRGSTHAPFADLNNQEIADLLEAFLREKGLDGCRNPHAGPRRAIRTEYTIPLAGESNGLGKDRKTLE